MLCQGLGSVRPLERQSSAAHRHQDQPLVGHLSQRSFAVGPSRDNKNGTQTRSHAVDEAEDDECTIRQPNMEAEKDVGLALCEVQQLYQQGQYSEALQVSLGMRDWLERELGEDHPVYASCLNNIALMYKMTNELEDAVHYYAMALDKYKRTVGTSHRSYAATLNNLGLVFLMQAQQAEASGGKKLHAMASLESAEATLREVLTIRTQVLEKDDPALLSTKSNLASVLQRTGRGAEAEEMLRTTLALVLERTQGKKDSPEVATAMNNLGYLLKAEGRWEEAREFYQNALRIRRAIFLPNHPQVIVSLNNLAELCLIIPGSEAEGKALQEEILGLLSVNDSGSGGRGSGEGGENMRQK